MRWGVRAALLCYAIMPLALMVAAQQSQRCSHEDSSLMRNQSQAVDVIVTAAPVYDSLASLHGGERFPQGAQLMLLRNGAIKPFLTDFAASADASLSFDGKQVLFAGKKDAGETWQIWRTGFDSGTPHLVLRGPTDLIRPLWMPNDRIVYARKGPAGFGLETAALDGSGMVKLSYVRGNFIPDDVLADGRILFESGFPLGGGTTPEMYLVYADGSGVESVRCDHPAEHSSGREHGRQMPGGDIVFTHGNRLARFTSPIAEESPITGPPGQYAGDIAPILDSRWLLSVRKPGEKHYLLLDWKPGTGAPTIVARDIARDLIEPVPVAPRPIPHRHPSALHPWTTGNLLALDARLSREKPLTAEPSSVRVETLDASDHFVVLGTSPVEKDGSFFLQAPGDRALRFILLDAAGHPLREEHGWFWVRSGEQRICVGCHTGPERAPENRIPAVLLRSTAPFDLAGKSAAKGDN